MEQSSLAAISESVLADLKRIAREELKLPSDQIGRINLDTSLIEGLQLDSLTQVVLLTELESRYGIVLDADDQQQLQRVETIGDLIQLIARRASSAGPSQAAGRDRFPRS